MSVSVFAVDGILIWTADNDWDGGIYINMFSNSGNLVLSGFFNEYSDWLYQNKIIVNNTGNVEDITDYQVLVNLSSSDFDFSATTSNGDDIRFTWLNETSDVEQKIYFWIESWDSTAEEALIWVKVPYVASSTNGSIYIYYGNQSASSESNFSSITENFWLNLTSYSATPSIQTPYSFTVESDRNSWGGGTWSTGYNGIRFNYTNTQDIFVMNFTTKFTLFNNPGSYLDRSVYFLDVYTIDNNMIFSMFRYGNTMYIYDGVQPWTFSTIRNTAYSKNIGAMNTGTEYDIGLIFDGTIWSVYVDSVLKRTITQSTFKNSPAGWLSITGRPTTNFNGASDTENQITIKSDTFYQNQYTLTEPNTIIYSQEIPLIIGQYTSNTIDTLNIISRLKATWNTSDSWAYKKEINISNTGAELTDYQFKIIIDKEISMNADYSDLRFTDNNNYQLNYWVEENNIVHAIVWVKVNLSAFTNTTINVYYGNPYATSKSNESNIFLFYDDFSSSSFISYENDCKPDSMSTSTTQSGTYYTAPYGAFIDTGYNGFCGDAGLVKEITLPDISGNISIAFAIKGWGAFWSGSRGIIIERDGYDYGPKACDLGQTYFWLACATRRGNSCGSLTHPETGLLYTPPIITGSWQEFTRDITPFSGKTFRLRILTHDYSNIYCNFGDHAQDLWVDDIKIKKDTEIKPTISTVSPPMSGDISVEFSADGTNWLEISNNTNYTIGGGIGSGTEIRYRINMLTLNARQSPKVHDITLEYDSGFNSCGSLSDENRQYLLNNDVSASGTCFTIDADNITLDCQGYIINYSQSGVGYGVEVNSGYDNITVKNCNIVQGSETDNSYAVDLSSSWDSVLLNNTITTVGDNSYGIYFSNSKNNTVYNTYFSVVDDVDIYVRGTGNYKNVIINSTFDVDEIYFESDNSGSIEVLFYFNLYVNDSNGSSIEGVNVTVWQIDGTFEFSMLTDVSGNIETQILSDFMQNYTAKYISDYVMNITKSGYVPISMPVTSSFKSINVTLLVNNPPQITIDSPLNSLYNHQAIWFNISVTDDWNLIDWCGYSLNGSENVTMYEDSLDHFSLLNDTVFVGSYDLVFYCNDTYGLYNSTDMIYFEVLYDCMSDSDCSLVGDICIQNGCVDIGCTEFCTYNVDTLCHSDCHKVNGCDFYDSVAETVCNNKPYGQWVVYDATQVINCCEGIPKTSYEPDVTYAGLNPLTVYLGDVADVVVSIRNRNDFEDTFTVSLESASTLKYWSWFATHKNDEKRMSMDMSFKPYEQKFVSLKVLGATDGCFKGGSSLGINVITSFGKSDKEYIEVCMLPSKTSKSFSRNVSGLNYIGFIILILMSLVIYNFRANKV
ncbi:MAG: DUF2341 domain-containing protein [DPANN group archaeon]|nr:DUF2341 domain-containing protein [DPANN group archaeon]